MEGEPVKKFHTSSSKSCNTKEEIVVTTPINKLPHANPTNAELETENIKLAGYIRGIAERLLEKLMCRLNNVFTN